MSEHFDEEVVTFVRMEGSWGATKAVKRTMKITAFINSETERGCFEIYDKESGGQEYYGEGGIWLTDGVISDYDGVGMIDLRILAWLDDLGHVDVNEECFFREKLSKYYSRQDKSEETKQ